MGWVGSGHGKWTHGQLWITKTFLGVTDNDTSASLIFNINYSTNFKIYVSNCRNSQYNAAVLIYISLINTFLHNNSRCMHLVLAYTASGHCTYANRATNVLCEEETLWMLRQRCRFNIDVMLICFALKWLNITSKAYDNTTLGRCIHCLSLSRARGRYTVRWLAVVPPWRHCDHVVVNGDGVISNSNCWRHAASDVVGVRRC